MSKTLVVQGKRNSPGHYVQHWKSELQATSSRGSTCHQYSPSAGAEGHHVGDSFQFSKGPNTEVLLLEFNQCLRKVELLGSGNEHLDARLSKSFSYPFCLVLSSEVLHRGLKVQQYVALNKGENLNRLRLGVEQPRYCLPLDPSLPCASQGQSLRIYGYNSSQFC